MKEIYVTKAVLRRYEKESEIIDEKIDLIQLFKDYILNNDKVCKFFNKSEVKRLLSIAYIFHEELHKKITIKRKKIKEENDLFHTIFYKGGRPKYHLYEDCDRLKRTYFDFLVPREFYKLIHPDNLDKFLRENKLTLNGYENRLRNVELFEHNENNIKELEKYESVMKKYKRVEKDEEYRKKAVEYLRSWFKINGFVQEKIETGEVNLRDIINRYNTEIVKKYIGLKEITSQTSLIIMYSNSGEEKVNFKDKEEIYVEIDLLVREREDLIKGSDRLHRLSKYDWVLSKEDEEIKKIFEGRGMKFTVEGFKKAKKFLEKHSDIKKRLRDKLIEYIRIGGGDPEEVLIKSGFECCINCSNRHIIDILQR